MVQGSVADYPIAKYRLRGHGRGEGCLRQGGAELFHPYIMRAKFPSQRFSHALRCVFAGAIYGGVDCADTAHLRRHIDDRVWLRVCDEAAGNFARHTKRGHDI